MMVNIAYQFIAFQSQADAKERDLEKAFLVEDHSLESGARRPYDPDDSSTPQLSSTVGEAIDKLLDITEQFSLVRRIPHIVVFTPRYDDDDECLVEDIEVLSLEELQARYRKPLRGMTSCMTHIDDAPFYPVKAVETNSTPELINIDGSVYYPK